MIATGAAAVDAVVELAATAPVTPKTYFTERIGDTMTNKKERNSGKE